MSFVEKQFLVMLKVFGTAVVADKFCGMAVNGKLGDENEELLPFGEHLVAEFENICKSVACSAYRLLEGLYAIVIIIFKHTEGAA